MDIRELSRAAYRAGTGEDLLAPRPQCRGLRSVLDKAHAALVVSLLALACGIALAWFHSAPTAVHAVPAPTVTGETQTTHPPEATEPAFGAGETGAPDPVAEGAEPAPVVVYVSGQVASPGVLTLEVGSRVVDAVDGAGGMTEGADASALNLARVLVDGEHVYVPAAGEGAPVDAGPPVAAEPQPGGGVVNLNTATAAELETLPGVGPSTAEKILAWREANGAFTVVDELLEVPGIGPAKFDALKDLVGV